jgi:lipopolysaccharide exporter
MSIALKTFHDALWKTGSTWLQVALDVLGVVFLARVLGPESYGVMGAVLLVTGMVRMLSAGALVECLVQRNDLNDGHVDAMFWSCVGLGVIGATIVFINASILSRWASVPAAAPYLQVAALLLPISAASAAAIRLQERALRFRDQARAYSIISVLSNLAGIGAALGGLGIWSLVVMEGVRVVGPHLFVWQTIAWRPGFRCRLNHLRELSVFNLQVIATYLIGHLDQWLPRALIGHLLGPVALGYFLIAARLFDELTRLVTGPLAGMCMAVVARLQSDRAALQRMVLSLYQAASLFAVPVFLGTIGIAPLAVPLLFGEAWAPAVSCVQILLFSALRTSTAVFNISILRATGRADLPIWLLGFGLCLNLVLIPSMSSFGLTGIMVALVLRQFLSWPLSCAFIGKTTGLSIRHQLGAGAAQVGAGLMMLAVVGATVIVLQPALPAGVAMLIAVTLGALIYALGLLLLAPALLRQVGTIARAAIQRDQTLLAASLGPDPRGSLVATRS